MCFPQPPAYRRRCPLPTRRRPPSIPCNGARGRLLGHRRVEDERRLQTEERNCTHRVQSSGCMLYKLIIWRGESRCGRRRGPRSAGCWSPASLGASQSSSSMSGHDESGTRPVSGATHFQENGKALEGVHGSIIFLKVSAFHRHGIICIISWKYSFHVDISVKLRALSF